MSSHADGGGAGAERILLVDDDPGVLQALQRVIRLGLRGADGARCAVDAFASADAALAVAQRVSYALAISDYRMPGRDGVEFLMALRELQPDCARIILSGYSDLNLLLSAINRLEIARFISKPWTDHELLAARDHVLAIRRLTLENRRLADHVRVRSGELSPQEAERRRLELLEPGITEVQWGEDGSFILEDPGEPTP